MCGIAGSIGPYKLSEEIKLKTIFSLKNRGPNASGSFSKKVGENYINLLHTRLSIIDVHTASNQPFNREHVSIVFNGEIYNYKELSNNLKKLGYKFQTKSDTEVLVCSYIEWGLDFLDKLEGMWSFALFDRNKNVLYLSRDRFGEKPLFYTTVNDTIFFASETKAISILINKRLQINYNKVKNFLVNGFRSIFKNRKETFFENVFEVVPASLISIDYSLKMVDKTYWKLNYTPNNGITENNISDLLKEKLYNSIKIRLRSDVPLAFCLSGGVDSSSLVSISKKIFDYDITTFSIIDDDERYNELENIKKTVDDLSCRNYFTSLSKNNFFENMNKIISYFESPIPTISYYIHNFLTKQVSELGYKVIISGTGADEIFSGYYDHYIFWLFEYKKNKNFENLINDWKLSYGRWVNNPLLKDPLTLIKNMNFGDHLYQNNNLFNAMLNDGIDTTFKEKFFNSNLLRNRMLNELHHEIVPVILRSDDLNSMMYSVENRSPFLDRELVEFAYQIPHELLIKDGFVKWPLRTVMNGIVNKNILKDTRKRGFNASILSLVDINDKKTKEILFENSPIFEIVSKKKFEKFLKNNFLDNSFSKFLFSFISTKIFLENFS